MAERQGGAKRLQPGRPSPQGAGVAGKGSISPARGAAFHILLQVATTAAHSDDLLHGPALRDLSQKDRDLAHALVLGVLRWQIALDARVRPLLSRPEMVLPLPVAMALRLGAFQLLYMERIPPHAALNESVELVRSAGQSHAAGMVNAVLRKIVDASPPRKPLHETVEAMAERLGHPGWLAMGWTEQYGRAAAERICSFDQQEPDCTDLFPRESEVATPQMDPGSRLVAELAAAAAPEAARVWDCCAAPGGKTRVLVERLPRASLLATDNHPKRLLRLQERLRRELPELSQVQVELADAAELPPRLGSFDLILCDVPCSGTGTLARNPEIRHRLQAKDLTRQGERQLSLLRAALARLAPGGRLLYSTCSLEPEECEEVVSEALREGRGRWQQLPIKPLVEGLHMQGRLHASDAERGSWIRGLHLRTLPGANFGGDGFFAALFVLVEEQDVAMKSSVPSEDS